MTLRTMQTRRLLGALTITAGLAMAAACNSNNAPTLPTSGTGTGGTGTGTTTTADVTITINGMLGAKSFTPDPGAVKVGQKVSWTNKDKITHTATGTSFDTGDIAPGATSTPITFSTAGTISYHCKIHPTMVGTLDVK